MFSQEIITRNDLLQSYELHCAIHSMNWEPIKMNYQFQKLKK